MGKAKPVSFEERIHRIIYAVDHAERAKRLTSFIAQALRDQLSLAIERSKTLELHTTRWMTDPLRSARVLAMDVPDLRQAITNALGVTGREPETAPERVKPTEAKQVAPYHGPVDMQCLYPGCTRSTHVRGYCVYHYNKMRSTNGIYIQRTSRNWCQASGCTEGTYAKGFCHKHYERWSETGNPLGVMLSRPDVCQVEGCDKPCHKIGDYIGYCENHAYYARKYGDPLHTPKSSLIKTGKYVYSKPGQKQCSVEGCNRPHVARGLCMTHWRRWRRDDHPNPTT